jgi:hypothetical protein
MQNHCLIHIARSYESRIKNWVLEKQVLNDDPAHMTKNFH